jgi:hypothetical protein
MADGFLVQLYDSNGQYVTDALTDQDLTMAVNRENHIDSGGKIYCWKQRYAQWRESPGVITLAGKSEAEPKDKSG